MHFDLQLGNWCAAAQQWELKEPHCCLCFCAVLAVRGQTTCGVSSLIMLARSVSTLLFS